MSPSYSSAHRTIRAKWRPKVEAGEVECWRCSRLIVPDHSVKGDGWDLGHDDLDPTAYRGPEHVDCNRATMGRRASDGEPERLPWVHPDYPELADLVEAGQ